MFLPLKPELPVKNYADRIRAMTDEELVVWLRQWCHATEDCAKCPIKDCPYKKDEFWLNWLRRERDPRDLSKGKEINYD